MAAPLISLPAHNVVYPSIPAICNIAPIYSLPPVAAGRSLSATYRYCTLKTTLVLHSMVVDIQDVDPKILSFNTSISQSKC